MAGSRVGFGHMQVFDVPVAIATILKFGPTKSAREKSIRCPYRAFKKQKKITSLNCSVVKGLDSELTVHFLDVDICVHFVDMSVTIETPVEMHSTKCTCEKSIRCLYCAFKKQERSPHLSC